MAVNTATRNRIIGAVLEKFNKEQTFTLKCHDGRTIDVDPYLDNSGYAVSTWETVGTYWDSDYRMKVPVHSMVSQKKCGTKQAVAEYIAGLF